MPTLILPPLILASGSRYRLERLNQAGLNVSPHPANIDETPLVNEAPNILASRLSNEKAIEVAKHYDHAIVIACDQVAALDINGSPHILGKPGCIKKAIEQLSMCNGKLVTFYTSLSVYDCHNNNMEQAIETVEVQFSTLSESQIKTYVALDNPLDCAGSFMMERAGIFLFESIHTRDPNNLLGIPMMALKNAMQNLGLDLFDYLMADNVNK